jgi:hypothetical protein
MCIVLVRTKKISNDSILTCIFTIFFSYRASNSDDPDNIWGEAALVKLESIDDDLDEHKILLVKMADMREAR